jgi:hypothetical protein
MLRLLHEESIDRAGRAIAIPKHFVKVNVKKLCALGRAGREALGEGQSE